jgi:predicted aspartyl protease
VDGRTVRLGADVAVLQIDRREAPATILVRKVDEPNLGVEPLEALGLVVDPKNKGFTPSRHYSVRSVAIADHLPAGLVKSAQSV